MYKYITEKWKGRQIINASYLEFSTSYKVIQDKQASSLKNWNCLEFIDKTTAEDKSHLIHTFKFTAWKKSMRLRNELDAIMVFLLTNIFIYFIMDFNRYLTLSVEDLHRVAV